MQKRLAKILNKMLTNNKHRWDRENPQNYSTEEDLLRHRTMLSECCWDKTLPLTVIVCKTLLHELSSYSLAAAIFASYKRSPPVLAQIRIKSDVAISFEWFSAVATTAVALRKGCNKAAFGPSVSKTSPWLMFSANTSTGILAQEHGASRSQAFPLLVAAHLAKKHENTPRVWHVRIFHPPLQEGRYLAI